MYQRLRLDFNGTTCFIFDDSQPNYKLVTDACPEGGSAICGDDWLYVNWQLDWPELVKEHINIKELACILLAARRWHSEWDNSCVNMLTDNRLQCLQ